MEGQIEQDKQNDLDEKIRLINSSELSKYFVHSIRTDFKYISRLVEEIELFNRMNFTWFIEKFIKIFNTNINKRFNMLRGSAGSSLLLYYLGINQIDPILYKIPLCRFINKNRLGTCPDIDIDVPNSLRTELMDEIIETNKDCTIRLTSDYKNESNIHFKDLIAEDPESSIKHNCGIIIYSESQTEIIEQNKLTQTQLKLTKNDLSEYGLKKIDILANTALEQLQWIDKTKSVESYDFSDLNVYDFIGRDDGIGITFAETPQIQNVIKILQPKNIDQLSICLAIVRPFACGNISEYMNWENLQNKIIYDDDFIEYYKTKMNVSEEDADQIRRLFKSNNSKDKEQMQLVINQIDAMGENGLNLINRMDQIILKKYLQMLPRYSFCKSHSINYARVIYCLYWNKFYRTKLFYKSTIKCIRGFYKDWVYIRQALKYGLKFKGIEDINPYYHFKQTGYWLNDEFMTKCYLRPKNIIESNNIIVEKLNKQDALVEVEDVEKSKSNIDPNPYTNTNEYEFRGIIASVGNISNKYKSYQMVITIGYSNDKFINLHLNKKRDLSKFKQVFGKGYMINGKTPYIAITHMTLLS